MNANDLRLMEEYLEGRLPAQDRLRVEERLAGDPRLAAEVGQMRQMQGLLRVLGPESGLEPVEAAPAFYAAVMRRVETGRERQGPWLELLALPSRFVYAGLTALVVLATALVVTTGPESAPVTAANGTEASMLLLADTAPADESTGFGIAEQSNHDALLVNLASFSEPGGESEARYQ